MRRVPFLVIGLINLGIIIYSIQVLLVSPGRTSMGVIVNVLAFMGMLLPLVPFALAIYFSQPDARPKDYGIRLFLSLAATVAPWLFFFAFLMS